MNVLRLSGCNTTEEQIVSYAKIHNLCTQNSNCFANGGTSCNDRKQILDAFGLVSETKPANIKTLARSVSQGKGVIVSVYAGMLYHGYSDGGDSHAITVISVKKNRMGNVAGFYVCDSNNMPSQYYTTAQMKNAFTGRHMNVTKNAIR